MPVGINEGTQTFITSTTSGTEVIPHQVVNSGTVGVVSNLTNGTVRVSVGTIVGGTVGNLDFGTVDTFYRHPDEFATVVNIASSSLGTVKAAVAGSIIYVTGMAISVQAASNVEIASGGTSTPIAGTFFFAGSGGAMLNFNPPLRTASGSALVFKQSSTTGLTITASGYVD